MLNWRQHFVHTPAIMGRLKFLHSHQGLWQTIYEAELTPSCLVHFVWWKVRWKIESSMENWIIHGNFELFMQILNAGLQIHHYNSMFVLNRRCMNPSKLFWSGRYEVSLIFSPRSSGGMSSEATIFIISLLLVPKYQQSGRYSHIIGVLFLWIHLYKRQIRKCNILKIHISWILFFPSQFSFFWWNGDSYSCSLWIFTRFLKIVKVPEKAWKILRFIVCILSRFRYISATVEKQSQVRHFNALAPSYRKWAENELQGAPYMAYVYGSYYDHAYHCICDQIGSINPMVCNIYGGQCNCKKNIYGRACDNCLPQYYNFTSGLGCDPCNCNELGKCCIFATQECGVLGKMKTPVN